MLDRQTPLRALIVDDEPLARSNLAVLLAQDPAISVVGQCGSADDAIAALSATQIDLMFLDIDMPECDGFELIERIGPSPAFAIVFVTAHRQFALRAFEVGALDYLLKPFDDQRFMRVLERAKERLRVPGETRRFIIKSGNALEVVKFAEIDWIEASDYYSTLHAGSRAHMLRRSLGDLDALLGTQGFYRIHRSAIVNLQRVRAMELREDGEYEVVLESAQRLRMSRRYRKSVLERFLGQAQAGR
jgi:two-component system LytT family response regulator